MKTESNTVRVKIRRFQTSDIEALFEAVRESTIELSRWLPWCHAAYAIEEAAAFVNSRDEARASEEEYSFAVVDEASNEFLGGVGLNGINRAHQIGNLGYWVRSSQAGRGVASTAARLAARFGFEELKLQRIEIVAAVENETSQRVAEKICATREAVLRKRLLIHNVPHDAALFSLVAEDMKLW